MRQQTVNQLLFSCSAEQSISFLQAAPPADINSITLSAIQSFNNQHLLTLRDLDVLSITAKYYASSSSPQTNIFQIFKANQKVLVWISLIRGYNMLNLNDKTKVYFHQNMLKTSGFWGYEGLELFLTSISSKDESLRLSYNQDVYLSKQKQLEYIMRFFEENPHYIPITFNYRDVLGKYICMNRQENKEDKEMLGRTIQRLFKSSNNIPLQTNFRYCFQFYRFPYDEGTSLYKPILSVFELLQRIPIESLNALINNSFLGLIWTQENYITSIRNSIKAGVVPSTLLLINKIKEDALKNNMIEPLILSLESDVQKVFIYLKFQPHFSNSFDLLQSFILGAPPRTKIYQKILPRISACINSIPPKYKDKFLVFLETVRLKYSEFCEIKELNELLLPFSQRISQISKKQELMEVIARLDWVSQSTKSKQIETLKFKGLFNIGNSCYMNSFLQSLYMTHEFRLQILDVSLREKEQEMLKKLQKETNSTIVNTQMIRNKLMSLFQLQKLFSLLYKSQRHCVDARSFKAKLPLQFQNTFQQDTIEFGRIYLSILQQFVPLTFQGRTKITIQCLECLGKRESKDKFLDLILSCEKEEESLHNLMHQINQPEELEGIECQRCNKRTTKSIRKHDITVLPNYCILTFNRFTYDTTLKKKSKLHFKVALEEYIKIPYQNQKGELSEEEYQLYSFIVHRGSSSEFGHYYTFAKQGYEDNSKWICMNDSVLTELESLSKISEFLEATPEDTPYVLFYQKKNHILKIKESELFKTPFILSQKLRNVVEKQDHLYLKSLQKQKFVLPKINFNFIDRFKKDDEDEEDQYGGPVKNNNLIL